MFRRFKRHKKPRCDREHARRKRRALIAEKSREGNRRGKAHEKKFVDAYVAALKARKLPSWIIAIRKATRTEDALWKTDAKVITSIGPIRIQVKSSERACMKFEESTYGRWVVCVVVYDNETFDELVTRTLPKIAARWHRRKENMQKRKHSR